MLTAEVSAQQTIFVGQGLFFAFDTSEEVTEEVTPGNTLNIIGGNVLALPYNGLYQITAVKEMTWGGKLYPHIDVERVGDIDHQRSIHRLALMNC